MTNKDSAEKIDRLNDRARFLEENYLSFPTPEQISAQREMRDIWSRIESLQDLRINAGFGYYHGAD